MNPVSSSRLRALLRPANGIALLALCLALGGTAVAASAITGKLVKDNSLTGRDVRNRSLTRADFRGSLRGPAGPRGAAGADGERGPIGLPATPGAPGATNVTVRIGSPVNFDAANPGMSPSACAGGERAVGEVQVTPPGRQTATSPVLRRLIESYPTPATAGATPTGWAGAVTYTGRRERHRLRLCDLRGAVARGRGDRRRGAPAGALAVPAGDGEGGRYAHPVPPFRLNPAYSPTADQPKAIAGLAEGIGAGERFQTLLGATGTGKTFTMAGVIERVQRPSLVIAHNKTLAAQLCNEFREFFPENAVEYFVSYYDYYQPEAYVPAQDLYIEKDSSINDEIDRLRHAATAALFARRDVIIVASVSCIYGIGSPQVYNEKMQLFKVGDWLDRDEVLRKLVKMQYQRNDANLAAERSGCAARCSRSCRPTRSRPTGSRCSGTRSRGSSTSTR